MTTSRLSVRGFTIVEMAISSTLFLVVSTVLLALFHQSKAATDKAVESTDLTSTMLVVFEKVRSEIRGVRIIGAGDGRLEYWKVRLSQGVPRLTPLGRPDYLPGYPATPESAFLFLESGQLIAEFQDTRRSLARLGQQSRLDFSWHAGAHMLTISGRIVEDGHGSDFINRIYVSNNE